ncbi:glutamine--fructose-6-phosphate transaminase (isomerizing), partial [candidate division TA06 bacterium]|nr:glutamine--fructose-6-phosphate transaminase (isomerizing) [candidate division TA06 bacterium]
MCGIVGYIGKEEALPILIEGLKRLEYRGYDSAGLAVVSGDPRSGQNRLIIQKKAGKVATLERLVRKESIPGTVGIAHTRWATHGAPTDLNAHPHLDCKGKIAVVHNGIIENYSALKQLLEKKGHSFRTETDTEVLAHLIEENYGGDLLEATRISLSEIKGTYGIAVLSLENPREIIAARRGSPLLIGNGKNEYLVASDVAAVLRHTREIVYLEDGELAVLTDDGFNITTLHEEEIEPKILEVTWTLEEIEKGGFPHFMLKEIFEQPKSLQNALRGRLNWQDKTARLDGLDRHQEELYQVKRIILTACGTAWHAGLIGEYMLEDLAQIPVDVEYASEFRYRSPVIVEGTILMAISQSGETADTLAAMKEAKRKGALIMGICNVVGSTIARKSDGGVYIHAGPEIGVASTKAFTSQLIVLALITLLIGRMKNLSPEEGEEFTKALYQIPDLAAQTLKVNEEVKKIAQEYYKVNNFLFLGRGINYPVALEGALKLKEISYIHAEGYPAGEMKHGPIALIDETMP